MSTNNVNRCNISLKIALHTIFKRKNSYFQWYCRWTHVWRRKHSNYSPDDIKGQRKHCLYMQKQHLFEFFTLYEKFGDHIVENMVINWFSIRNCYKKINVFKMKWYLLKSWFSLPNSVLPWTNKFWIVAIHIITFEKKMQLWCKQKENVNFLDFSSSI